MSYSSLVIDNPKIINPDSSQWSIVYQPHEQSVLYRCIIYFTIGLFIAPWSAGIVWLILFIIIFEIFLAIYRRQDLFNYNEGYYLFDRVALCAAPILGFIVGRTVIGDTNPLWAADEFKLSDWIPWM